MKNFKEYVTEAREEIKPLKWKMSSKTSPKNMKLAPVNSFIPTNQWESGKFVIIKLETLRSAVYYMMINDGKVVPNNSSGNRSAIKKYTKLKFAKEHFDRIGTKYERF